MEQRRDSNVDQLDLKQAYTDLRPRLVGYTGDAEAAYALLGEMSGRKILFSKAIQNARQQLGEVAEEHVRTIKGQFCGQVYRSYPAGSEGAPELMSPKRFIRENGLDSRIRPELRDAQARAVADSKERLVTAVQDDETHQGLDTEVSKEELENSMIEEVEARLIELKNRIEEIKELMPIIASPVSRVGSKVVGMVTHQEGVVSVSHVTEPADPKEKAQLNSAIFALRKVLQELSDGETVIGRQLAEQYAPNVRSYLEGQLITRYEQLEAAELARLPGAVEAAYAAAANIGPSYQPKEPTAEQMPTAPQPSRGLSPERPRDEVMRTVEVKNPFEWCASETVSLTITKVDGQAIVSTVAMTPNMAALTTKLRAADSQMAKKFDDIWERIKAVELNGETQGHGQIKSIRTGFNDLSVYYYRTFKRNGPRVYYARTNLSQVPELAAIAHGAGIAPDTNLIILLAETDKKNQPKALQELNAQWRFQGHGH